MKNVQESDNYDEMKEEIDADEAAAAGRATVQNRGEQALRSGRPTDEEENAEAAARTRRGGATIPASSSSSSADAAPRRASASDYRAAAKAQLAKHTNIEKKDENP